MKRWIRRGLFTGLAVVALWFGAAAVLPFPEEMLKRPPENTRFLDAEGGLLRRTLAEGGMDHDWISLAETGEWTGRALIAVEDQRFYRHPGVDPLALSRAVAQNVWFRRVVSGASTLSSQVIRMARPRPRRLTSKGIEFFRATQLELRYDKAFILEQYLNRAPLGGNRYGVATGARRYFGKEPGALSAGEAALLMGLPQSPSRYRPERFPARAERRRETVLRRMREEGMLEKDPLLASGRRWVEPPLRAYAFTEWVRRRHGHRDGDLPTTLDPEWQAVCEAVARGMREDGRYTGVDGLGMLVVEASTGKVRAWVGSRRPDAPPSGAVDTVTRRRAPGSVLKPFAYALGMEGGWLTPDTGLEDRPRSFRDYTPANMEETWSGGVSVRHALVRSLNLPALQVVERVGVAHFLGGLRSAGLSLPRAQPENVGLGAVLGGGMEASLLELCEAYTVFANGGAVVSVRGLEEGSPSDRRPLLAPGVAYWISEVLSGPERDEALYGSRADVGRPALAFKTGTSHGHRDAWALGWNGEWVVGVWVGRLDGESVPGMSGSTHAAPLLGRVAERVFSERDWPRRPPDVRQWRGRWMVTGVTDPVWDRSPGTARAKVVSPAPDFTWKGREEETLYLNLRAVGPRGEAAHWFLNGRWLGEFPLNGAHRVELSPGRHTLRAVFADGRAETRRVQVL